VGLILGPRLIENHLVALLEWRKHGEASYYQCSKEKHDEHPCTRSEYSDTWDHVSKNMNIVVPFVWH